MGLEKIQKKSMNNGQLAMRIEQIKPRTATKTLRPKDALKEMKTQLSNKLPGVPLGTEYL